MHAPSPQRHRLRRYTARLRLRLDAQAQAKLVALRTAMGRLPPQVLRETIDWGLRHGGGWRVDRRRVAAPATAIVVRLEPAVRAQLHAAARAAGGEASAWVCHALAQVPLAELLAHRETGRAAPRAHDSRHYDRRYMLRLDDQTWEKLVGLARHFSTAIAEVVRQLVAQAEAEEFPARWQSRARTLQGARPGSGALSP